MTVDRDGILWERYRRGHVYHGPIADADPPLDLASDHAHLLDQWHDAFDDRAEQLRDWEWSQR